MSKIKAAAGEPLPAPADHSAADAIVRGAKLLMTSRIIGASPLKAGGVADHRDNGEKRFSAK